MCLVSLIAIKLKGLAAPGEALKNKEEGQMSPGLEIQTKYTTYDDLRFF